MVRRTDNVRFKTTTSSGGPILAACHPTYSYVLEFLSVPCIKDTSSLINPIPLQSLSYPLIVIEMSLTYQSFHHPYPPAAAASAAHIRHPIRPPCRSSENTLRIFIDRQALLRELRLAEEVQRHPHQMPLDLVELAPHLARRPEQIVDVACLARAGAVAGEEATIVVHGADCEGVYRLVA